MSLHVIQVVKYKFITIYFINIHDYNIEKGILKKFNLI